MAATFDWVKKNIPKGSSLGAAGIALSLPAYVKELTTTENKLKAIVKITADWLTWTLKLMAPLRTFIISGALVKGFVAVGDAIKGIVRSTGSLQAALERLKNIQFTQQQLAPLVGGMAAAKQRVAELIALSAKGPFRFEEIATANRSLEVFTRGIYSSAKATQMIGQVAVASGNNITEVADAVGQLYQNLREGRSIESSVESLRQMGIVSDQAAQGLIKMSQAGATTSEVFGSFTTSMQAASEGLGDLSDNIETVSAEHAKAKAELQKAFGAPWVAAEVTNYKNLSAAMVAITPAVAKVSQGFAVLYNGMSTFRTTVIRSIAELPLFQQALVLVGQALQAVLAAAALFGTIGLISLLPKISGLAVGLSSSITGALLPTLLKMGISFTAATQGAIIFANVLRGLAFVAVGSGIVAGLVAIVGTALSVAQAQKDSAKAAADMRTEFDRTSASIQKQIAAASSLAERHEALAKAINNVADAQAKLKAETSKPETMTHKISRFAQFVGIEHQQWSKEPLEVAQARANVIKAQRVQTQAFATSTAGLTSPEREAVMKQASERARAMEEEQFQERIAMKTGPARIEELQKRAAVVGGRAETGAAGAEARAQVGEVEARRTQEIGLRYLEPEEREKKLGELKQEMLFRRQLAGPGTSVQMEAQMEILRHSILAGAEGATPEQKKAEQAAAGGLVQKTPEEAEAARIEIARLKQKADQAKLDEEASVQLAQQTAQLQAQITMEKEQYALTMSRVEAEGKISDLRGTSAQKAAEEYKIRQDQIRAEMALEESRAGGARPEVMQELDARLKAGKNEEIERVKAFETTKHQADVQLKIREDKRLGRSEDATALKNELSFEERFNQHRAEGMENTEASQRAMAETAEDIKGRVIPGGPAAVVSSLQEIGGGGGIYAPGGDPALVTQKLIAKLTAESNTYLKLMSTKGEGVK